MSSLLCSSLAPDPGELAGWNSGYRASPVCCSWEVSRHTSPGTAEWMSGWLMQLPQGDVVDLLDPGRGIDREISYSCSLFISPIGH